MKIVKAKKTPQRPRIGRKMVINPVRSGHKISDDAYDITSSDEKGDIIAINAFRRNGSQEEHNYHASEPSVRHYEVFDRSQFQPEGTHRRFDPGGNLEFQAFYVNGKPVYRAFPGKDTLQVAKLPFSKETGLWKHDISIDNKNRVIHTETNKHTGEIVNHIFHKDDKNNVRYNRKTISRKPEEPKEPLVSKKVKRAQQAAFLAEAKKQDFLAKLSPELQKLVQNTPGLYENVMASKEADEEKAANKEHARETEKREKKRKKTPWVHFGEDIKESLTSLINFNKSIEEFFRREIL